MQYGGKNRPGVNHPVNKLKDYEQVTEETILTSLRGALNAYSVLQAHDGHWPGGYSGILFIMPLIVCKPSLYLNVMS